MSDILNKTIVLVLNRNWQAINIRTPQDAFCQMATNAALTLMAAVTEMRKGRQPPGDDFQSPRPK